MVGQLPLLASLPAGVHSHVTEFEKLVCVMCATSVPVSLANWASSTFCFQFPQIGAQRNLQPGFSQGQSQRDGKEMR